MQSVQQEALTKIVERGQIDPKLAKRLAACMDSKYRPASIRYVEARNMAVIAGSELLSIMIIGFGQPFEGRQLICCNKDNPEPLETDMGNGAVFQSIKDPDIFYVAGGQISITGLKNSDVTKDLDAPAQTLNILPKKDPDVVRIDDKEYRQTGTVCVRNAHCFVVIER
jgi:hypothetical protein